MERKPHFYVSKKNLLTWVMVLCMVCSVVARFIIIGAEGPDVWCQIVLPVAACLLYMLITVFSGKEHFYKTAIPVWMIGLYYFFIFNAADFGKMNILVKGLLTIALFFTCVFYTQITAGKERLTWAIPLLHIIPMGVQVWQHQDWLFAENYTALLPLLPDALMTLGLIATAFAIGVHPMDEYHPTWGDRVDGRKVRTLAPMAQITSYFQVERNTCCNLFDESFEITHVERYIRQKRKEGYTDFGFVHVFLAAYVRGLCKYPQLNRFISGQKVFSRGEDIQYCMVVKKEMTIESPDTSIKVHLSRRDTAVDVYHKLNAAIEDVKKTQELDSGIDNLIAYFNMVPGVVLKFVVWLLKLLDYFGLLPKFLLELSPFHGSLFFTSMGSLGIPPIYHHLYDFGNIPAFGAFGCKRRALELQEDGSVVQKKYIDMKFVLDERIVDGYYYAAFFKHYRSLLRRPEVLDQPPEEIINDID